MTEIGPKGGRHGGVCLSLEEAEWLAETLTTLAKVYRHEIRAAEEKKKAEVASDQASAAA